MIISQNNIIKLIIKKTIATKITKHNNISNDEWMSWLHQ